MYNGMNEARGSQIKEGRVCTQEPACLLPNPTHTLSRDNHCNKIKNVRRGSTGGGRADEVLTLQQTKRFSWLCRWHPKPPCSPLLLGRGPACTSHRQGALHLEAILPSAMTNDSGEDPHMHCVLQVTQTQQHTTHLIY